MNENPFPQVPLFSMIPCGQYGQPKSTQHANVNNLSTNNQDMTNIAENPNHPYMAAHFAEWEERLEQSSQLYGLDDQAYQEMRAFLQSLKEVPAQCALLEKHLQASVTTLDESHINAVFDSPSASRFHLLVLLLSAHKIEETYRKAGYPDGLWKEGLGDLMLWLPKLREDLGVTGLNARIGSWVANCQKSKVIQVGRLQCEMHHEFILPYAVYRENDQFVIHEVSQDTPRDPKALLQYGDAVINLHIPAAGPLKKEACLESLRRMKALKKSLGEEFRSFVCYSWLLDEALLNLLPPHSNIREFASLGHLLPECGDETNEVKWRLWNQKAVEEGLANVPQDTALRKNVVQFLEKGGKFKEGAFFILPEEI